MAEFPALTLWTDAYLSDTRFLSTLEHGAYLLLLIEAWRRPHCDLPDDDKMLARMAGLQADQWAEIRDTIMAYWTFDGRSKTWKQKRLSKERDAARTRSKSQRDKAAKRWNKNENGNAAALPAKSHGNASITTAITTATDIEELPIGSLSKSVPDPDPNPEPPNFELELVGGDAAEPDGPLTPDDILETWNEMAARYGLPIARGMTKARLAQAKARLREFPSKSDWETAFQCITRTPFLLGENSRGWRADLDFMLQAKSFTKLVEGSYGQA